MERTQSIGKDVVAGIVGGLAASWVMSQLLEAGAEKLKESLPPEEFERRMPASPEGERPTAKVAAVVAEKTAGKTLTSRQKEAADPIVHYVFGGLLGGLYGILAGRLPAVDAGRGVAYGTAVWLGADVMALPLLDLSKPPQEYPASTHAFAAFAHWVYGVTLDATARAARWAL